MATLSLTATAQSGKVPPFNIMLANGKVFKAQNLPIGKPIVIIYFSPDCDHCEKLMNEFFKRPNDFKNASVTMVTYLPVDKVLKFTRDYKVEKYPNIFVGTEGESAFLRNYYKIYQMPFMALYNKNGDLQMVYKKENSLNDLALRLKSL